jgi:hypothetical protein
MLPEIKIMFNKLGFQYLEDWKKLHYPRTIAYGADKTF